MLRRERPRRGDAGASAVEFAIIAPLVLILIFGMLAFGTLFAQKLAVTNDARQAARLAVVANHTCQDILTEAINAGGTIAMDATVTPSKFHVEVQRLNADGTVDTTANSGCTTSTGATSPTPTNQPCLGSTPGQEVRVYARWDSSLFIPLVFANHPYVVEGQGIFRCEFR